MSEDDVPPLEDLTDVVEKVLQLKEVKTKSTRPKPNIPQNTSELDVSQNISRCTHLGKTEYALPDEDTKGTSGFGGMKKGFLFGGSSMKPSQPLSNSLPAKPKDEIPFITKKPNNSQFQFEEVQSAMKINEALMQNKDELLKNIEKNEQLYNRILDPNFMAAISEFQRNPETAREKYKDNPEVQGFFRDFCSLIGDHLTSLGDRQPLEETQSSGPAQSHFPDGADLVEVSTRRRCNDGPVEEDQRVNEILSDPEIKSILINPKICQFMEALRNNPATAERLLQSADQLFRSQVQKLVQTGLLQIQH